LGDVSSFWDALPFMSGLGADGIAAMVMVILWFS